MTSVFTLFLPGIESWPAAALPRMPALERLLARGRARSLDGSPWDFLARLAGGDTQRWAIGPVSALGELGTAPRACLRAEPLGAAGEQQAALRLPAAGLGITRQEASELAAAVRETFGEDGLWLEIGVPERWYLAWDERHPRAPAWLGCPGPVRPVDDGERPAPPEPSLRRVTSELELLFHAHPVNAARREAGAPTIAGLHTWGGGRLLEGVARDSGIPAVAEEPYLAGLRRLGAVPGKAFARSAASEMPGNGIAWPLAVETLAAEPLASIERDWARPLLTLLRRGRLDGVRIVTGRVVHETRRTDALRFWRRPRPVGELC